ncbi:hypothetical protein FACS1894217_01040 [Clostridia bacterium]|nr:hypothetical protein FACS1894217_01040 [Clostridia bacterium]
MVGSGVAEVLDRNAGRIPRLAGRDASLSYILDLRDFPDSPFADKFTKSFNVIINDPEVGVIVETIGGVSAALDYTRQALERGISVVTSNKELVATHGHELLNLARENNANYLFEASVGGGIPIIRPLSQCLLANNLQEVYGILNGTTNFILTRMFERGASFKDALGEAQRLGYAERDPRDDISGKDVARKVCILASLAFGNHVTPDMVSCEGIEGITRADVDWAAANGFRVKLLGRAVRLDDSHIAAYVAPHMVPIDNPLSDVSDVYNGIVVCGDAVGDVMFYGRGAGKLPTASAVVADVIDALKHMHARKYVEFAPPLDGFVASSDNLPDRWYHRTDNGVQITDNRYGVSDSQYTMRLYGA